MDAAFGAGAYTSTVTDVAAVVRSFSIGAGATLALAGGTSSLTTSAASVNYGTVKVSGGYLVVGADFANYGTLFAENGGGFIVEIGGSGTIFNGGLITGTGMYVHNIVHNDDGGVIQADAGGIVLAGATTNNGLIEALHGGTFSTTGFGGIGSVTNFDAGTLSGGTWAAIGSGSTILLANTTVNVLGAGATVILSGAGSNFRVDDGSDPFYLEQTLTHVKLGAALEVLGGRDYNTTEGMLVDGAFQLGGGTFTPNDLRAAKGSTVSGFGTIASQAIVDGTLRAEVDPADHNDTLQFTTYTDFNGRVTGKGTLELSGGEVTFTTSHVTVAHLLFDGADIQIDKSFDYAGELTMTAGLVDLRDSKLTLSGETTLSGGTIEGGPGGKLIVSGALALHTGAAELDVRAIRVDGAVAVDHGTLTVNGAVTGGGKLVVGDEGTLVLGDGSRLTAAGPMVSLLSHDATLVFDNLSGNGARIADFDGADRIDFSTFSTAGAKLAWRADDDGIGGTLRLTNATQTTAVHLEENHLRRDFVFASDGVGGTVVMLTGGSATAFHTTVDAGTFGNDRSDIGMPAYGEHLMDLSVHTALT